MTAPAPTAPPSHPDVTVVLPVRNEAAHLGDVLADLRAQELGDLTMEVLVVDGESDDDTVVIAGEHADEDPRVRVLHNPRRLSSGARAIGADEARGRYVAYVDGHCRIPSRTLLRDMVELFERSGADCLARPQPLVPSHMGHRAAGIAAARASPFGHSTKSTIFDDSEGPVSPVSAGAMYRREVFEKVGNFDVTFDACEDVEFNWRVERSGLLCWTSPALALAYEPRRTYRGLFRQMVRYGLGRARLHRKHPESFTVESLVPAAFTAGLPLTVIAPLVGGPLGWALAAPYLAYAALCTVFSVAAAAKAGWRTLPFIPPAFVSLHAGLGWGYLKGRLTASPPAP